MSVSTLVEDVANGYSGLGSLVGVTRRTKPTGAERVDERFMVDALGNQLWHRTRGMNGLVPFQDSTVYSYDRGTGRLIGSAQLLSENPVPTQSTTDYVFDASGNQNGLLTDGPVADIDYSYYGADEKLRVLDHRDCAGEPTDFGYTCSSSSSATRHGAFEEYRYDALGRRVLVQSRRDQVCERGDCLSAIERTVWDGDQVLYEIRYPAGTLSMRQDSVTKQYYSLLEADTLSLWTSYKTNCFKESIDENGNSMCAVDTIPSNSQHYGRAMYLHGLGIDAPLLITRMGYYERTQEPITVMPHANWRELYDGYTNITHNSAGSSYQRLDWPGDAVESFHLDRKKDEAVVDWFGSIVKEKRDGSGQLYMRNRYYDPATGRFTQEDPIGLAGGLNSYGFADGDPVNYSDPFGLRPSWLTAVQVAVFSARMAVAPMMKKLVDVVPTSEQTTQIVEALKELTEGDEAIEKGIKASTKAIEEIAEGGAKGVGGAAEGLGGAGGVLEAASVGTPVLGLLQILWPTKMGDSESSPRWIESQRAARRQVLIDKQKAAEDAKKKRPSQ